MAQQSLSGGRVFPKSTLFWQDVTPTITFKTRPLKCWINQAREVSSWFPFFPQNAVQKCGFGLVLHNGFVWASFGRQQPPVSRTALTDSYGKKKRKKQNTPRWLTTEKSWSREARTRGGGGVRACAPRAASCALDHKCQRQLQSLERHYYHWRSPPGRITMLVARIMPHPRRPGRAALHWHCIVLHVPAHCHGCELALARHASTGTGTEDR